jgi:hypothetical protein
MRWHFPFPQFHRHNRAVFLLLLSVVVRVRRGVWEGFVDGHQWNVVRLFFNIFFNIFQCGDSAICIQQRRKLPRSKTAYRTRQCDNSPHAGPTHAVDHPRHHYGYEDTSEHPAHHIHKTRDCPGKLVAPKFDAENTARYIIRAPNTKSNQKQQDGAEGNISRRRCHGRRSRN